METNELITKIRESITDDQIVLAALRRYNPDPLSAFSPSLAEKIVEQALKHYLYQTECGIDPLT